MPEYRKISIIFSQGADKLLVEEIISVYRGSIAKRRAYVDSWVVHVPAAECFGFMGAIDITANVLAIYCDIPIPPTAYHPTEYLYQQGQRRVFEAIGVPDAWELTKGEGVGAIILGSGVVPSEEFPGLTNYFVNPSCTWVNSPHETMVASAFASEDGGEGIVGIAPAVKPLISFAITKTDASGGEIEYMVDAMEQILALDLKAQGYNVISLSYSGASSVLNTDGGPSWVGVYGDLGASLCNMPIATEVSGVIYYGQLGNIFEYAESDNDGWFTYYDAVWEVTPPSLGATWLLWGAELKAQIAVMKQSGYLVCMSAGNGGTTSKSAFATTDALIVGSSWDATLTMSTYSSRGAYLDVCAPSDFIMASYPKGGEANYLRGAGFDPIFTYSFTANLTEGSSVINITSGASNWKKHFGIRLTSGLSNFANSETQDVSMLAASAELPPFSMTLSQPALSTATGVSLTFTQHSGYCMGSGTSFATPLVGALACLVWSLNKTLSPGSVKQIIKTTATTMVSSGSGTGRINALSAVMNTPPPALESDPISVTPSITAANLTGTLTAQGASVTPTVAVASATGVLSADSITITPSVATAELAQVAAVAAASMTLTPSLSPAELTGVLAAESVNVTPSMTAAQATGIAIADAFTLTPSIAPAQLTPVLVGSGSIRSPSGAVLDIRRIDGTPITIRAAA
jgi:hypothetical protein